MATQNPTPRLHPNGKRKIRICDVEDVYGYIGELTPQCYGRNKGWNSLVTPEEVDAASDQLDAQGVYEEAMTGFGVLDPGVHGYNSD
ncbi:hypothetical protein EVG20_g10882 [Dentipellis fragilis]|uniref:Uncharacterized protein n=1 Tax=Dentipellis fragilis TaxID=205917 RepID=A0A4Y9XQN2_9AGAM|nr:hypothetical protein EVG20_g10882 [Dentipellis fragilis]